MSQHLGKSLIRSIAVITAALLLGAGVANARTEKTLAYSTDQVWSPALRFLRIDAGLTVTEKDPDAGYVLFELHEDNRTFRGALEIYGIEKNGHREVVFALTLTDRPPYMETMLLDKLEIKLRAELGMPNANVAKRKEPAKDAPKSDDKGTSDDKKKGSDKAKAPDDDRDPADDPDRNDMRRR